MSELAKIEPQEFLPESSAPLMVLVGKLACTPGFDKEAFQVLLAAAERQEKDQAKRAFIKAMIEMKPKLPVIDRKGRIEIRAKSPNGGRDGALIQSTPYARWEDIDEAITPILADHGFMLRFHTGVAQDGKITVTAIISHDGGHEEETTVSLPHDPSGSKNSVQAVGSSLSYGKRYAATSILNIRTKGEDDDGNSASGPNDEEKQYITYLLDATGADVERFLNYYGIESTDELNQMQYRDAKLSLERKARSKGINLEPPKPDYL